MKVKINIRSWRICKILTLIFAGFLFLVAFVQPMHGKFSNNIKDISNEQKNIASKNARAFSVDLISKSPSNPSSRDEVTIYAHVYGGNVESVTLNLSGVLNKTFQMTGDGENYTAHVGRLSAGVYNVEVTARNTTGGSASSSMLLSIRTLSISLSNTLISGDYIKGKGYKPSSYLKISGQIRVLTEANGSSMEVYGKIGDGNEVKGLVEPNGTYTLTLTLPAKSGEYEVEIIAKCLITGETENATHKIKVASADSTAKGSGCMSIMFITLSSILIFMPMVALHRKKV